MSLSQLIQSLVNISCDLALEDRTQARFDFSPLIQSERSTSRVKIVFDTHTTLHSKLDMKL